MRTVTTGEQQELHGPGPLLDEHGRLTQAGWARQPVVDCSDYALTSGRLSRWQRFRSKRWDYYGISLPDAFFSFMLVDLGYVGQATMYTVDFASVGYHEEALTIPLGRGIGLPSASTVGVSSYDNGKVRLRFSGEPGQRRLDVRWPRFGGRDFSAQVTLSLPPEHESMAIVIPIGRTGFYQNRKVNCLPATGAIAWGDRQIALLPERALGNMDWGWGIWPYRSFWVWATASGFLADGRTVGLNLGYGFGDTSAAGENALILAGRIHKLARLAVVYDAKQVMTPWRISAPDGRARLEFVPFFERAARTNLLLVASEMHQIFGRFHGVVLADDGEPIALDGLVGAIEEHHARW